MTKIKSSWLDNFIGAISPRAGLSRLRYKAASDILKRRYEGAAKGRRTEQIKAGAGSANTEISGSLLTLRNRSRDLVRNNSYAARGVQGIVANTVGRGIMTQFRGTPARNETRLNELWKTWSMTTACDWDGRHNLMGLQRLVMRSVVEGGETIVRLRRTRRQSVRGLDGVLREVPPIQLQVLEGDFLDSSKLTAQNTQTGNLIIQGIEVNQKTGKREAYLIFEKHPGGLDFLQNSFQSNPVPANEIAHIYRQDRLGQMRGVPWWHAGMMRLRDLDEFIDTELIRQKVASCFTAFVHDIDGLDSDLNQAQKDLLEKLEPATIEHLPPGKDIKLAVPPSKEGYKEYVVSVLHELASSIGVTYEVLTGDLSEVNFSSARMGFLEFNRNIDTWRWQILMPQFLWPVTSWFKQGADLIGVPSDGFQTIWTPPKREMVDPTKEVPALRDAVRGGFTTLSDAIRQGGRDPDEHFKEYKADIERLDKLGIILDTDPRKTQKSGAAQVEPGEPTNTND